MIESFADRDSEKIWQGEHSRKLEAIKGVALRKLFMLAAAQKLEDLQSPPGNRLELLKGDRAGQHSIRVNDQYRVCFVWKDGKAHDVQIVDYH